MTAARRKIDDNVCRFIGLFYSAEMPVGGVMKENSKNSRFDVRRIIYVVKNISFWLEAAAGCGVISLLMDMGILFMIMGEVVFYIEPALYGLWIFIWLVISVIRADSIEKREELAYRLGQNRRLSRKIYINALASEILSYRFWFILICGAEFELRICKLLFAGIHIKMFCTAVWVCVLAALLVRGKAVKIYREEITPTEITLDVRSKK